EDGIRDFHVTGVQTCALPILVGLEIKREFTVGRLASRHAAALPVAGAIGGMLLPASIYIALAPAGLAHGWGTTISTDTAFAIARSEERRVGTECRARRAPLAS